MKERDEETTDRKDLHVSFILMICFYLFWVKEITEQLKICRKSKHSSGSIFGPQVFILGISLGL